MPVHPARTPKPIEVRFQIDPTPLTYLAMANGHGNPAHADIARAAIHTCCYLWMLAHPDFKPAGELREVCLEHAEWLLEPDSFSLLVGGASSGPINLNSKRLQDFETAFMSGLLPPEREPMKLQSRVPKGLWRALREAYGIKHGGTDEGFTRLLLAFLRQARAAKIGTTETNS